MSCAIDSICNVMFYFNKFAPRRIVEEKFLIINGGPPGSEGATGDVIHGMLSNFNMIYSYIPGFIYLPLPYIITNGERWISIIPSKDKRGERWIMKAHIGDKVKSLSFKQMKDYLMENNYDSGFVIYKYNNN